MSLITNSERNIPGVETNMRKADRISGIFWLFFALVAIIKSYRLGLGNLLQPGPGFLFFWAGIFLGIMSLVIIAGTFRRNQREAPEQPIFGNISFRKIILVLIAVFLYALLLENLGFIVVTMLFFIFVLGVVEGKGWPFTILSSITVTVVAYLAFQVWLQVQMPLGILGFIRF